MFHDILRADREHFIKDVIQAGKGLKKIVFKRAISGGGSFFINATNITVGSIKGKRGMTH